MGIPRRLECQRESIRAYMDGVLVIHACQLSGPRYGNSVYSCFVLVVLRLDVGHSQRYQHNSPLRIKPRLLSMGLCPARSEYHQDFVANLVWGLNNQLKRASPLLFGWEVVGIALAVTGLWWRNKVARKEVMKAEITKSITSSSVDEEGAERRNALPGLPVPFADYIYMSKLSRHGTV
jgi:hypothetical protein